MRTTPSQTLDEIPRRTKEDCLELEKCVERCLKLHRLLEPDHVGYVCQDGTLHFYHTSPRETWDEQPGKVVANTSAAEDSGKLVLVEFFQNRQECLQATDVKRVLPAAMRHRSVRTSHFVITFLPDDNVKIRHTFRLRNPTPGTIPRH